MKHLRMSFLVLAILLQSVLMSTALQAQDEEKKDSTDQDEYQFVIDKELPATAVKNQYRTGTCWSFSTISFLESELLRMGKGEFDLSEMFIARNAYRAKAEKYMRMHGTINFAGGGAANDVTNVMNDIGLVPESAYSGKVIGKDKHIHGEMDGVFKGYMDAVRKNKNGALTPAWKKGFDGLLDAYLGDYPAEFEYEGKTYTPRSFNDEVLGLKAEDYVMLTSYTHHPFYGQFVMEVPDNWSWGHVYNLPLDEFSSIFDHAIESGYTIAWATDVSEKTFLYRKGLAILPEKDWLDMSKGERDSLALHPVTEKNVTQESRQKGFDNYETQDDHGMHITGLAHDAAGGRYYYVKNSWGTKKSEYNGYFYASKSFVLSKTISIMVHKDAVPAGIRQKLGIE